MKFIRWIIRQFKRVDSRELRQTNTDNVITHIPLEIAKMQAQIQEAKWFTRANTLTEEFMDESPTIMNSDGTVFYCEGDLRNTFNPRWDSIIAYEDEVGNIVRNGNIKEVDEIDEFLPIPEEDNELDISIFKIKQHINEERNEINYLEGLRIKRQVDKLNQKINQIKNHR